MKLVRAIYPVLVAVLIVMAAAVPVFAAGIVIDGWLAIEWAQGKTALSNRPLFLGGILLIIVGIQFISLGLLGEMISKSKRTTDEYAIRDYIK